MLFRQHGNRPTPDHDHVSPKLFQPSALSRTKPLAQPNQQQQRRHAPRNPEHRQERPQLIGSNRAKHLGDDIEKRAHDSHWTKSLISSLRRRVPNGSLLLAAICEFVCTRHSARKSAEYLQQSVLHQRRHIRIRFPLHLHPKRAKKRHLPPTASTQPPPPDTAAAPRRHRSIPANQTPPHRNAPLRPIHTRSQVRNAQRITRRAQNRLRRSHPVNHAEDLQLRLQLIRYKVHGNISLANGILHRRRQLQSARLPTVAALHKSA